MRCFWHLRKSSKPEELEKEKTLSSDLEKKREELQAPARKQQTPTDPRYGWYQPQVIQVVKGGCRRVGGSAWSIQANLRGTAPKLKAGSPWWASGVRKQFDDCPTFLEGTHRYPLCLPPSAVNAEPEEFDSEREHLEAQLQASKQASEELGGPDPNKFVGCWSGCGSSCYCCSCCCCCCCWWWWWQWFWFGRCIVTFSKLGEGAGAREYSLQRTGYSMWAVGGREVPFAWFLLGILHLKGGCSPWIGE